METSLLAPWLALYHCLPVASRHHEALLDNFQTPADILSESPDLFEKAGMPAEFCEAFRQYQTGKSVIHAHIQYDLEWLQHKQHHILTLDCDAYPALLKAIPDPPLLLYVWGNPAHLSGHILAMVGSRKPTSVGKRLARRFAAELTGAGITISSGLAFGIDGESHKGALDAGGLTIAVLGGGLQCLYPKQHESLAKRIAEQGCVVSEFPLNFEPKPWCFPRRNRLVTGLGKGVLVVEATLKSGSLGSASCALEQGRDVYAIPGFVEAPQSKGCHKLIKQGAALVESAEDILEDWPGLPAMQTARKNSGTAIQLSLPALAANEALVMEALDFLPLSLDLLAGRIKLSAVQLSGILGELEIKGRVLREATGYCKVNERV